MATPKRVKDLTPKPTFDKTFEIEVDKAGESESQKQSLEIIVGDREFDQQNYVTNGENPTVSINKLDKQVKVNATAIQSLSNAIDNIQEATVLNKVVTIWRTEILALYTAKKELFALPATNKIRSVLNIFARLVFKSVAYSSTNRILIGYEDEPAFAEFSIEFLQSNSTVWHRALFLPNTKMREYKRIVAWMENTNPKDGDGYIQVYITYQELGVSEVLST